MTEQTSSRVEVAGTELLIWKRIFAGGPKERLATQSFMTREKAGVPLVR